MSENAPAPDGERSLGRLLASMEPKLQPGQFRFCSLAEEAGALPAQMKPLATFREAEGLSVVVDGETAEQLGIAGHGPFRCITLTVHSSLEAVGLTAAVAGALAAEGISCNVVAATYHDHLFVPAGDAERALAALRRVAAGAA